MPSFTRPLKLAYFSPLPPEPSGISDYSRELLPSLSPWAEVDVYIDDYTPTDVELTWKFPTRNHREYSWRRFAHEYDFTLYHLGNSPVHAYLYPYVSRYPGVIVLHDWVLHHFMAGQATASGRLGAYFREMAHVQGPSGAQIAWDVTTGQKLPPYFEYPLSQRSLDASLGVIVHSKHVADLVRTTAPGTPVAVVPMGIPLPPDPGPKAALRQRLALPAEAFIIGSFGLATPYKRITTVLNALANLLQQGIDAYYVVVGEVAPDLDLAGTVAALGLGSRVRVTGYATEHDFNAYLHAVDVCVNLRYPTAGETSASALRCLAAGQATIVSNVDANRELPEACLIKVPVGPSEVEALTRTLDVLARSPGAREQLGQAGRAHIERNHTLEQAARGYISFLEDLQEHPWRPRPSIVDTERELSMFQRSYMQEIARHLRSLTVDGQRLPVVNNVADALADLGLGQPSNGETP